MPVLVSPDPLPARITASGVSVGLVDFAKPPASSGSQPLARFNFLYSADDGSGRLFAADTRGPVWLIAQGQVDPEPFLDLRTARSGAVLADQSERGLRSFAFHPDFENAGTPGYGKFYTISTETVASASPGTKVLGGPFTPLHHDVLAEWQVSASDPTRIDVGSRREVLRIAEPLAGHNADQIMFDPNAGPGDADYGLLYIGTGDGGYNPTKPDAYDSGQSLAAALGKILRIDPLRQADGSAYAAPSDNPFVGQSGALPEIWALGLRHPQNIGFDRGGSGHLLIADIGEYHIEEVNLGVQGANYGWQPREGTFASDRTDHTKLYALPDDDASFGFTYPVAQYDHTEGNAITGGFVYRGSAIPALSGHYLFGDIVNGRIFHVPVDQLRLGQQAEIRELTLLVNGQPRSLYSVVNSANNRVDLRFGQGEDGEIYILTKQDGMIRKLAPAAAPPPGNAVSGTGGNDTLNGTGGNDSLNGLAGDDSIYGRDGNDTCVAGPGRDFFTGGAGADVCLFSPGEGQDKWLDFQNGTDKIALPAGLGYSQLTFRADTTWNYLWVRSAGVDVLGLKNTSRAQIDAGDFVGGTTAPPPSNVAPVAKADSAATTPGTAVEIAVLGNDTDANGDVLAIASFTQPANGTVVKDDQGTVSTADDALVYTPKSGFTGSDTFSYVASDASPAGQSSATVTVTVRTAPAANTVTGSASSETLNGTTGNDSLNGLAGNDTIRGGAGNDTCVAGPGLDFFYGEGGNDVCRFSPGEGQDKWWDYQDGTDKIGLPAGIDYGDLTFRADTTWNYLWVRSGGADVLGLKSISQSQIDAGDFVLV